MSTPTHDADVALAKKVRDQFDPDELKPDAIGVTRSF